VDALALAGRHALITGGGRGIGLAIARQLMGHGARVTLLGRDTAVLADTERALAGAGEVATVGADVAERAQVDQAFAKAVERFGDIAILVNNAGQAQAAPFVKTDAALWQQMLSINLTGTFHCTQAALPPMLAAKAGRIVNIASTAGLTGYSYVAAYCAAKHGVIGLTRALAIELATTGITVNAVCPGYTETDLVRTAIANIVAKTGRSAQEARAELAARNPQKRLVLPEEVANAVSWLCLPGSEAINGLALPVAGGEVM
jgi:NAD(P)-dependent dehydrogenase (short-subunit alcohol dehydrogenase family)